MRYGSSLPQQRPGLRAPGAALALAVSLVSAACIADAPVRPLPDLALPSCRATAWSAPLDPAAIQWADEAVEAEDRPSLDRWCRAVGPPVYLPAARADQTLLNGPIAVVSWNVNVGAGDLRALVADLRSGRLAGGWRVQHFVMLLQEALRRGPAVPSIGGSQKGARRLVPSASPVEIVSFAREAGLSLYYVPSMRNGLDEDGEGEDRGNAILSTLPLTDLRALELPFERQRRVVAIARIGRRGWVQPVTVASVHLDPFVSARRLWFFGAAAARARQARVLAAALRSASPLVVGGDFNTWSGPNEPALVEMRQIADVVPHSAQPTFGNGRVLDHLFFRTPSAWRARYERAAHTYGSDHFPLVGWMEAGGARP